MENIPTTLETVVTNLIQFIPSLIAALIIFILSFYLAGVLSKLIRKAMQRRKMDQEVILLVDKVSRWTVIIIGTIAALQQIGFDVTSFLAGLGILGFTVGFALQDVSKNFIAGLLLLWQQPFDIGDAIKVGEFSGTVKEIDIRATILHTLDGLYVSIPNGDVFTSPITNYSREKTRRVSHKVGVAYGTDLEKVHEITTKALLEIPGVLTDPKPEVVFDGFGGSSIDFTVYYWVNSTDPGYMRGMDKGLRAINAAFERDAIEIPYPIRTLIIPNSGQQELTTGESDHH